MSRNHFAERAPALAPRDPVAAPLARETRVPFVRDVVDPTTREAPAFAHRNFAGRPVVPAAARSIVATQGETDLTLASDADGGTIQSTPNDDGSITVEEILEDGSVGDTLTIPAPTPPDEDGGEDEEPAEESEPAAA